ncbi:MAG TPA: peptidylprolyl isomerase [Gemmatimonadaceae bacterium]|nr:peptidylprolyl isomerase [Gemmatimonadaceae bacterium]
MKRIHFATAAAIVLLAACDKPAPPPADTATPAPTPPAAAPAAVDPAPATFRVRIETSRGPIVVEATREWAPNGVDRFYHLVEAGYYDDVRFFRVVPGFVVQFGMHGDPATNAKWTADKLMDDPVKQSNTRGMVVFAQTSMPNSRTTQLFINLGDNSASLDDRFAPIGKVVEGMSVVDALYSGYGDNPTGKQGEIAAEGNAFLKRTYPKLDYIRTAKVVK